MPQKDRQSAIATQPYEIGQEDRLHDRPLYNDKFMLSSEQLLYTYGYHFEDKELNEVLPYITPFKGRKNHGSS